MEEPSRILMVKPINLTQIPNPKTPHGFPMKQQAFNPNQSKPNIENLIEQYINQQITINK